MSMNVGTNYSNYTANYSKVDNKSQNKVKTETEAEKSGKTTLEDGVIYDRSGAKVDNSTYSITKMNASDRAAIVSQLKSAAQQRENQLISLVQKTLSGQARVYGKATGDDIWKTLAGGNFTVDAATKAQAQNDIGEDGYWGVKQTSQRLFDFACALAGDDVDMMMSEVQLLVERLRQSGVGEVALQRLFKPTLKLSRLHIQYGRIFLPDYNNMEIKMPTLSKAIYMLYLRRPEGIMFSYLPDYRDELLHLYGMISGRDNREDIQRSIDDVTDPTRNSINEKCSRIKQAFLREFDDSIAHNYYITGERGEAKKILLSRDLVTWDMPD